MALLIDVFMDNGISVEKAYAQIENLSGKKNKIVIYLNYYVNADAAANGTPSFKQSVHEFIPSTNELSLRWDKQAYEFLKTVPEFEDAIDVLE